MNINFERLIRRKIFQLFIVFIAILHSCKGDGRISPGIRKFCDERIKLQIELSQSGGTQEKLLPRSFDNGKIRWVKSSDWTSGFFPGILWKMYEISGEIYWKEQAESYTILLKDQQYNTGTHDLGFMMYCSFGQAYHFTGNHEYRKILIQSARSLASRFDPDVGCIRSWDHHADLWDFPVIIDNMMNLELLFWAFNETGEREFHDIAISHAMTTIGNHFRDNSSSWHVVDYDTITGEVRSKVTNQGYSDESAWSRGQAWGLYGFTMTYRETGRMVFLTKAEEIAGFILDHPNLPEDFIPYWDFDAQDIPDSPRDASAAAIIASALYELAGYSKNRQKYLEAADRILESLTGVPYLAKDEDRHGFLLKHSTGNMPIPDEVDVPMIYADYYFLEALIRQSLVR